MMNSNNDNDITTTNNINNKDNNAKNKINDQPLKKLRNRMKRGKKIHFNIKVCLPHSTLRSRITN